MCIDTSEFFLFFVSDSIYLVEYIESRLSRMYLREGILDYRDLLVYPQITCIDDMEENI